MKGKGLSQNWQGAKKYQGGTMDEDSPFKIFQSLNSEKQNQGKKGDQGLGTQIQSSVKKPAAKLAEQKEDQNCSHFF